MSIYQLSIEAEASQSSFQAGLHPLSLLNGSQPLVITLLGPTASGKTALALEIAERLDLPVINVDSQLYQEMNLGAKQRRATSGCAPAGPAFTGPADHPAGVPGGGQSLHQP